MTARHDRGLVELLASLTLTPVDLGPPEPCESARCVRWATGLYRLGYGQTARLCGPCLEHVQPLLTAEVRCLGRYSEVVACL